MSSTSLTTELGRDFSDLSSKCAIYDENLMHVLTNKGRDRSTIQILDLHHSITVGSHFLGLGTKGSKVGRGNRSEVSECTEYTTKYALSQPNGRWKRSIKSTVELALHGSLRPFAGRNADRPIGFQHAEWSTISTLFLCLCRTVEHSCTADRH